MTVSVDKNPVIVNESFILTVVADDDVNNNALDTSPLLSDFIVGRTSVSSQTSMVNFKTTRTTTWTTVLIPRKEGQAVIPSLRVENYVTDPISIAIVKASDLPAKTQQSLFITNSVSATNIYVQQQITLTVKLHFSAELKRGSLTEPVLADANILQVGKDKESESIINGKRYRIIERIYAISPQKSGDMILKSPVFSGEVIQQSSRRSNFLSFANSKPISVVGEDIPLTIKAIPDGINTTWLPSELLALHQEWQPTPDSFKVGDPITRTITLTAAGLSEEQLPKIDVSVPDGLKIYPDQAELHTGLNNGRLVSQKVVNFAIVASAAGEYLLPEITIPWWNTVTNKQEFATLASEKITILPNKEWSQPAPDNTVESLPSAPTLPKGEPIIIVEQSIWQWVFLALWLLTLLAWYISIRRLTSKKHTTTTILSNNNYYLQLLAACKKSDGKLALELLIPWANSYHVNTLQHKEITTIDAIHSVFNDSALSHAIIDLQRCYYAKQENPWQGAPLLQAIQAINSHLSIKSESNNLAINP